MTSAAERSEGHPSTARAAIDAVPRSPWVRDAAAAAGLFLLGLLLLVVVPDVRVDWWPAPGPALPTDLAILGLACLGGVLRRRVPLAGLVLVSAAFLAGPLVTGSTALGVVLVFSDLLYCCVLYTTRAVSRTVCVVTGVLVAVLTLSSLLHDGGRDAVQVLLNLALLAVPVLWAAEVRRHRDLADVERSRAEQASRMAEMDRQAAVTAERARMARDLHDVVAGQLSAIALQSEAALEHRDPDLRDRVLRGVREASVSALAEMRTMIGLLREDAPQDPRTAPARLDQLDPLLTSARAWGLDVRVRDDRPADIPTAAGVELAAYRIVQEGLTNVAKHAPGAEVAVRLRHADGRLEVTVRNGPGRSGPPGPSSGGTGLDGLAERAAAVGGTMSGRPDGTGWVLSASLPLEGTPSSPSGRDRTEAAAG